MDERRTVRGTHQALIDECRKRLGRELTDTETAFITSRAGYLSLQMAEETIKTLNGAELEAYLNSSSD